MVLGEGVKFVLMMKKCPRSTDVWQWPPPTLPCRCSAPMPGGGRPWAMWGCSIWPPDPTMALGWGIRGSIPRGAGPGGISLPLGDSSSRSASWQTQKDSNESLKVLCLRCGRLYRDAWLVSNGQSTMCVHVLDRDGTRVFDSRASDQSQWLSDQLQQLSDWLLWLSDWLLWLSDQLSDYLTGCCDFLTGYSNHLTGYCDYLTGY